MTSMRQRQTCVIQQQALFRVFSAGGMPMCLSVLIYKYCVVVEIFCSYYILLKPNSGAFHLLSYHVFSLLVLVQIFISYLNSLVTL